MSKTQHTERNILVAFILNLSFSLYEFIGGAFTNSSAIMSDAVHDLGDALSIGISYFLEKKSHRQPDANYTYGYIRYSLVGGMVTTLILLIGSAFVIYHAVSRLLHPTPINYNGMIILAVIGVIVNFAAAWFTREGNSLNQKSVNLHMLEDVLGWVVVLIGAIIMRFTDISLIDPLLSLIVAGFILKNALTNFHDILTVFLEKSPTSISIPNLTKHLRTIKNIQDVHHLHIWSMDGFHHYATLHVVTETPSPKLKSQIRQELKEHDINHVTIEFETPDEHCHETSCHIEHNTSTHAHAHHHHHH